MTSTLDIVISFIVGGMLLVTVLSMNANLMEVTFESNLNLTTQMEVVDLSQALEYDFYKIGYGATSPKITNADSASITFKSDIDRSGTVQTIQYYTGTPADIPETPNPRDVYLYKKVGSAAAVPIYYGITSFKFYYYDSVGTRLSTPITTTSTLELIKSIRIETTVESSFPYDTTYATGYWERTIFPKNL